MVNGAWSTPISRLLIPDRDQAASKIPTAPMRLQPDQVQ
jgi:hypothetical protein